MDGGNGRFQLLQSLDPIVLAPRSAWPSPQQCCLEDRRHPTHPKSIKPRHVPPEESAVRAIAPHLFDGIRRSCLYGTNPTPVKACEQRSELRVAQCHWAIPDVRLDEGVFLQPPLSDYQSASTPVDALQTIRFPRPEYEDRTRKRVFVRFVLDQSR